MNNASLISRLRKPARMATGGVMDTLNTLSTKADGLVPYASNIVNAFQKPPLPAIPTADTSVTLTAPSYNAERSQVSSEINATNAFAARNVDGNTAARIALANQGQKLDRLSSINERENNQKSQISNQQALINSNIQARNNDKTDVYNNQLVERSIAGQRASSANIANAADKYVGIQNEKRKAAVDVSKTRMMSNLFDKSGVGYRLRTEARDNGETDPWGLEYSDLPKKKSANGGFFKTLRPRPNTSYRQLLTAKPQ